MELGFDLVVILFCVACLAGFVDTIAGGGGLITLPALLLSGLPIINALSTNKLQSSAGTFTASCVMILKKQVILKEIYPYLIMAFLGSIGGTLFVKVSDVSQLKALIPIVIFCIGVYFLCMPQIGLVVKKARVSARLYKICVVPLIGMYDGMIGPGTGSFFTLTNIMLQGRQIIQATAQAKLMNFATNIASLCVFILAGDVVWLIGGIMVIGQFIGAFFGAKMILSHGTKIVRPMIVIMCFAMLAKYGFDELYTF